MSASWRGLAGGALALVENPGGPVATVTVNRPGALNALDAATLDALLEAFRTLAAEPSVRCVIVLTGAGEKAFVAGADIKAMSAMTPAQAGALAAISHRLGEAIAGLPAPVIAAVNGFALGGGCELALCCDFIYASRAAKFWPLPATSGLGVIPRPGRDAASALRRIGLARASELLFTGAVIDADEALRLGLVNVVLEPSELLPRGRAGAAAIAARAPLAVAAAKRAARDGAELPARARRSSSNASSSRASSAPPISRKACARSSSGARPNGRASRDKSRIAPGRVGGQDTGERRVYNG